MKVVHLAFPPMFCIFSSLKHINKNLSTSEFELTNTNILGKVAVNDISEDILEDKEVIELL